MNENRNTIQLSKSYGKKKKKNLQDTAKNSSKREVYSNSGLPQETRKITKRLSFHLKELEKEEQNKSRKSAKGRK